MRFADVNRQKIDVILVIVVKLDDIANLAAERRSSEAAKNEHQQPPSSLLANVKRGRSIECQQRRVGCLITDLQIPAMHVRESVAHHVVDIFRTAGHETEKYESGDEKNRQ